MNRINLTRKITVYALLIALVILFTFVTYLGYIPIGPITLTTMHVFVLIGAIIFGWKGGLILGFVFGLSSLIRAGSMPTGPVDMIYVNPFISVLPRVLFGLISGLIFDFLKTHVTRKTFLITSPFICFGLTVLHSILTLSCLYLFGILDPFGITEALGIKEVFEPFTFVGDFIMTGLGLVTLVSMIGEATLSLILITLVYIALSKLEFVREIESHPYYIASEDYVVLENANQQIESHPLYIANEDIHEIEMKNGDPIIDDTLNDMDDNDEDL